MTDGSAQHPDAPLRRARSRDPFRWIIENPGTVDLFAFGGAALLLLVFSLASGGVGWWTLFTVPMVAAGALCRVRPLPGVLVIGALAVLHLLVNVPVVLGDVMTFYAMFCAVAHGRSLVHGLGIAAGMLGVFAQAAFWALDALRSPYGGPLEALVSFVGLALVGTITIIAIWALANLQRARLRQLALTRDRAEQALREREQRTALAVADERARIAREMHDVVAHSLSVIIAQADGGRFIAAQKPEQAAEVLGTIGETGRAALADMRSLLGVLRQEDETSFGPQPGPEMLPELVERVRGTGLQIELEIDGSLEGLPQALGVSVFRLAQESLTNVLKHAGPGASAVVRVHRDRQQLMIEVSDDGQGTDPDSDGQGHGLTGMRERMSVFGGSLQAGPLPSHGYRVRATVPLAHEGGSSARDRHRQDPHRDRAGNGTDPDDPAPQAEVATARAPSAPSPPAPHLPGDHR
ncbi:two-component sensor histidine kinase [Brachybacterium vulturis]|uniref:histidine kinase n=1 Tax=Brachybacterium vulturis TaxID=2017484 RepID=A0A291GN10_9MICO|nr:sensor histidine kinase [Brachybacterium vulturis]ATG51598.1 two-component sensor histidine kinase [Brachybacterium vulturis]